MECILSGGDWMKKISLLVICFIFLVSCNTVTQTFTNSNTIIDWVDFVNINGNQYQSIYTAVIADSEYIGEKVGEVNFKVSDNVTNPSYRTKDGDAAFWKKGTEIFSVKDQKGLIAIPDESEINGYRIYSSDDNNFSYSYKDIDLEAVNKIEIYEGDRKLQLNNTLVNEQEIAGMIAVLNDGETNASFNPNTSYGDPTRYQIVLYSDEPIAYNYSLFFDGSVWYWYPWDTSILADEIKSYIK